MLENVAELVHMTAVNQRPAPNVRVAWCWYRGPALRVVKGVVALGIWVTDQGDIDVEMTPAAARALADALRLAADKAEFGGAESN
jgi:hypothetical protein